jgi:hypothetical protein
MLGDRDLLGLPEGVVFHYGLQDRQHASCQGNFGRFAQPALSDDDAKSGKVRDGELPNSHRFRANALLSAAAQKTSDLFCNRSHHKNFYASSPWATTLDKLLCSTFPRRAELPNAPGELLPEAGATQERTL